MSILLRDKELNRYRDLVRPPGHFEEGFGWKAVFGAIFVGVVMLPAAMYMSMAIGADSIGPAAQWVTVILFLEMAKRARSALKPAEILILFGMAGMLVSGPTRDFFWRQYLVQSEGARSFGISELFPSWYAPSDPDVLDKRSFFSSAWLVPIGLMFLTMVISRVDSLVLGYGLFRITSDVEKLPFPMAPLNASGVTALAENVSGNDGWRWRCFCIGSAFGLVFGFLYVGIPTLTGTFLREPYQLLPIPWLDTSVDTQRWLPAVPTGISLDMVQFFLGMALPFFGVLGSFVGMVLVMVANPLLYQYHLLQSWKPGMSTIETMFANNVDFYLSFGIGLGLAVAAIGIVQCVQTLRSQAKGRPLDSVAEVKPVKIHGHRGDIRTWLVVATYLVSSAVYILLAGALLHWDFKGSRLMWVLLFFAGVYTPFISYMTARLEGMAGQAIGIPFVREAAFIVSGYRGIDVWLLPIPLGNYGADTVGYRTAELVGCSFRSMWKLEAFAIPVLFILSLVYAQFIWGLGPIPSSSYPYAQQIWDLDARNTSLVYSSTLGGFSPFMAAIKLPIIAAGGAVGVGTYYGLASFGLPVLLVYGLVKGLGGSIPQAILMQFMGAMFGRFVMARRFGADRWMQYSVVLFSGYACGAGLISMFCVGIKFLSAAVFQLPY